MVGQIEDMTPGAEMMAQRKVQRKQRALPGSFAVDKNRRSAKASGRYRVCSAAITASFEDLVSELCRTPGVADAGQPP